MSTIQPHVLRTSDYGATWEDISSDLPEIPVNDIIVDPFYDDVLYIANDLGVWYTSNLGLNWHVLGTDMPLTVVNDLDLHSDTRTLIAGTFGRSMLKLDLTDLEVDVNTNEVAYAPFDLKIYPNPVANQANVELQLQQDSEVLVELYDLSGKKLQTIFEGTLPKGEQVVDFDASKLSQGKYFVRILADGMIGTERFVKL